MVAVHHLVFFVLATSSVTKSTDMAVAEFGACRSEAAEPAVRALNCSLHGLLLIQDKSVMSRNGRPKVSKTRFSLVKAKASSRGRFVVHANLSRGDAYLVQANTSSRGNSTVQTNAIGSGSSMVQANTSGNGTVIAQSSAAGTSREPGLQERRVAQQGSGFGNVFADLTHRLARSQQAPVSTGVWICVTLIIFIVISCFFATWAFISNRPQRPSVSLVRATNFSRGAQQHAALSGKAASGGMSGMFVSAPSLVAYDSSGMEPEPAFLAAPGEQLASQVQLGAGAETVCSLPSIASAMHPCAAAAAMYGGIRSTMSNNPHFCSDLVVPPGCECIMQVPSRCLSNGPFEVCDPNGNGVLKVEPRALHQGDTGAEGLLKLVFTTGSGITVSQCMPSPARIAGNSLEREQRECALICASGDTFALIKLDQGQHERYTLTTQLGGRLQIWGNKRDQAMNVVDGEGKLVAKTWGISDLGFYLDPENAGFNLRVAPLVDVGLILCGLLCIHHLM